MTSSGSGGRPRVTAGPLTPRAQVQVYAGQFGPTGPPGPPNTLTAGPTTTGAPGSQANVVITGTAPNQSIAFTIPRGDVGPQGDPTAFELRGSGSPQNSVAAPVGSYYTDTAATNGAIRWIKQTGTGTTGWRVVWGDTGWRNIASYITNGWTVSNLQIRRIHNMVQLHVQALNQSAATSDVVIAPDAMWTGWQLVPAVAGAPNAIPLFTAAAPAIPVRLLPLQSATLGLRVTRADNTTATQGYTGQVFWQTSDLWPTSLP